MKMFQNPNLGEQGSSFFRKLPSWKTSQPFDRFSHVIHRWIQQKRTKLSHQHFSKVQSRGAREQFFSKTTLLNNFWTVRPIFHVIHRSIQQNKGNKVESSTLFKLSIQGSKGALLSKTSLLNDFSTVWPIFIKNTPIDSAKQVE
jgi:hypothetical protein